MRLFLLVLAALPAMAWADAPAPADAGRNAQEQCLLDLMRSLPPDTTLAELRQRCAPVEAAVQKPAAPVPQPTATTQVETDGSVNNRLADEWKAYDNPFALALYRPSYFIFGYQFSPPNEAPFTSVLGPGQPNFQNVEAKFQISLKFPLALNLFDSNVDLIAAYTNRSFWQSFNHSLSSPFRETDHEPEAWLRWRTDFDFLGGRIRTLNLGIDHQSNGQSGTLSRSWNRIFAETFYERGPFGLDLRIWHRIQENPASDDNPDILDYMGHFQLTGIYHHGKHEFTAMGRYVPGTGHGAYQLDWSYPLYKNLHGYVQWFDGYGESLIDYNYRTRSLGIGVQLGEWL